MRCAVPSGGSQSKSGGWCFTKAHQRLPRLEALRPTQRGRGRVDPHRLALLASCQCPLHHGVGQQQSRMNPLLPPKALEERWGHTTWCGLAGVAKGNGREGVPRRNPVPVARPTRVCRRLPPASAPASLRLSAVPEARRSALENAYHWNSRAISDNMILSFCKEDSWCRRHFRSLRWLVTLRSTSTASRTAASVLSSCGVTNPLRNSVP